MKKPKRCFWPPYSPLLLIKNHTKKRNHFLVTHTDIWPNLKYVTNVLRSVLKHVPSWILFQIGIVCHSKKCAFLKYIPDWHRANFVSANNNRPMSAFLTRISCSYLVLKNKQTNNCSLAILGLFLHNVLCFRTLYWGLDPPVRSSAPPLEPQMKWHFVPWGVYGEQPFFESRSAPLSELELAAPHFEKSGNAPAASSSILRSLYSDIKHASEMRIF